jgi:hypothetical protein
VAVELQLPIERHSDALQTAGLQGLRPVLLAELLLESSLIPHKLHRLLEVLQVLDELVLHQARVILVQ